jgi:hypothetical protein
VQFVAVMTSSRRFEQSLFEDLTTSDQSSSSDDDDSSGTNDLTVGKVIVSEYSDDVQCATASSAPSASSAKFTWEDMTNYVGQRENFFDNCGPQNEAQNETVLKCLKCFLMTNSWKVRETNT